MEKKMSVCNDFLAIVVTSALALCSATQVVPVSEADILAEIPINIMESDAIFNASSLRIFAVTLTDYLKQLESGAPHCNMTLVDLGFDLTSIDSAENDDIDVGECALSCDASSLNYSVTVTINDDSIAEFEEIFILYTNHGNVFNDSCALPVRIIDNDRLYFNFSTAEMVVREGEANLNISIVKTGLNEPNISFRITFTQSDDEHVLIIQGTNYVFTPSTAHLTMPFTVLNDHIYGNSGEFRVCLLDIIEIYGHSDLDFTSTFPDCVTVTVQDNDVARIGFLNNSIPPLKEGQASAKVCVGFKHPVDTDVDISVPIKLRTVNYFPDTGHDLYITKQSITLDAKNTVECFEVYAKYDTNIKESEHNISLGIQEQLLNMSVILEESVLEITVEDAHGIDFLSEPRNVSVGIGKEAYFPCVYDGSNNIPLWNISTSSGWKLASINRLPPKHYYNGTGMIVWDIDTSHNLTSYSCLFQIFDQDRLTTFSSNTATLTVVEDISFHLTLEGENSTKSIILLEGDPVQKLTISRTGHTLDTYLILIAVLKDYEGYCGFGYVDIEWFIFEGEKANSSSFSVPHINEIADDIIPERLKVFKINISTADMIKGESSARVTIDEPVIISLYDNDVSVGFTNQGVIIDEKSDRNICLKAYNEVHPSVAISFDLLESGDFPMGLNISPRRIQFTNSNSEECVNLTIDSQVCDGNKTFNIHIVNISHPETVTVITHHPNIMVCIIEKSGSCTKFNSSFGAIIAVAVLAVLMLSVLVQVITLKIYHKKRMQPCKKADVSECSRVRD